MARAQFYLSQEAAILGFPVFSITIPLKKCQHVKLKEPCRQQNRLCWPVLLHYNRAAQPRMLLIEVIFK